MSDTFGDILSDIEKADLKTHEGRAALEARIRSKYAIRDILLIRSFIRGGIFISTTEPSADSLLRKIANGEKVDVRWTQTSAGIVTETHEEGRELTRLWEALVRSCYVTIGAASVLKIQDSRFLAGYAFADEGDGPTVYDFNLDALARKIPKEYAKQLDAASRLDRLQQTADRNGQGVAALVHHLPDAKKPKTISWKEAASIYYPALTAKKTNGEFCYTEKERKQLINSFSRNCRNWIKEGRCPKSRTPISWDDLTSTQTWKTWVEQEKIDARKPRIVSEKTGLVEDQRGRRRSPTAQSGK